MLDWPDIVAVPQGQSSEDHSDLGTVLASQLLFLLMERM
jgi:hypothetical protein